MTDILQKQKEWAARPDSRFSLLANAVTSMAAVDWENGEILMANAILCEKLHLKPAEIEGRHIWDIIGRKSYDKYRRKLLTSEEIGWDEPLIAEYYWPGKKKWLQITARPTIWPDGRKAVAATITDITWIRKCKDEYKSIALYDGKLNIPNSVKLERDLAEIRSCEKASLICLDIYNLRVINDIYGWDVGDALLFQIRDWLMELQIPGSCLYRIGADEFGMLTKHIAPEQINEIAEFVQNRFEKSWTVQADGQPPFPLYCTVTIAVAHGSQMFGSQSMISLAERILRNPYEQGRLTVYDAHYNLEYMNSILMQQKLAVCIQQGMNGFEVHYQPIVDPNTSVWHGLEALCRWDCPGLGRVPPAIFIPEAERMGLIGKIGEWVLERSVSYCKGWGLDEHENFILDINVSPLQMKNGHFVNRVLEVLEKHEYPGYKLGLEITESEKFIFDVHSMDAVEKLIRAGVAVALDDFGTGYSSFHNLKNLPAGILKTEKSFIDNIEQDYYAQQLFRVMVELAHVADKKLIAEGVETAAQRDVLISHEVDFLQGYLFSKPLPPLELEKNLYRFF